MKLGKREATHDERDLLFKSYLDQSSLPPLPAIYGHGFAYTDWGMLGNDGAGDCTVAGGDHETMLWNKIWAKRSVAFSEQGALADYSAITGYNPADPNTDQGAYVRDVLNFRRKTGLLDSAGNRHLLHAYAALRTPDWFQLLEAIYLFGAAAIGFQFPHSGWAQFDGGQAWDVVPNDGGIDGGHYVCAVGFGNPRPDAIAVITWGKRQVMTQAFYEKYVDEAWALISAEAINSLGRGPHGFTLAQLDADLAALTA